jgi:hypothetical protein
MGQRYRVCSSKIIIACICKCFKLLLLLLFFFIRIVGGGVHIRCSRGTAAMYWPIVPVPGDCEDGEVRGMKCRPTCQTRARSRAAAVGSQRLVA